jgi:hypothetical protein
VSMEKAAHYVVAIPNRPRTDELAFSQSPPYSGIRLFPINPGA